MGGCCKIVALSKLLPEVLRLKKTERKEMDEMLIGASSDLIFRCRKL